MSSVVLSDVFFAWPDGTVVFDGLSLAVASHDRPFLEEIRHHALAPRCHCFGEVVAKSEALATTSPK